MKVRSHATGFRYTLEPSDIRQIKAMYLNYFRMGGSMTHIELMFEAIQDVLYQLDYEIAWKLPYGEENVLWRSLDECWLYKGKR
jgi:hypothetical protein